MAANREPNSILTGGIFRPLMMFFLPIVFGTFFQQLYNTVDTLIVGNFVGTGALAAVGATGVLVQLLVGFFTGLCSGAGVVVSQSCGAGDYEAVNRQVHTALTLSAAGGALLTAGGVLAAPLALRWMNTPAEILADAALYLQLYFAGMIPLMVYNMGTGILRAVGDSKRPLYFLIIASFVNIALDILLVAGLHWGVAGAAVATVLSEAVSALLTLRCLYGSQGMPWHLGSVRFGMDRPILASICRVGLPTAMQSMLYSVSNIFIQSAINAFGTTVVAAWSVYGKIDFLFWMTISSLGIAITTFVGQNFGAGLYDRVKRGTAVCMGIALGLTVVISTLLYGSARLLFRLFSSDAAVVEQGVALMHVLVPAYITYITIEILSGVLRGCGDVKVPTLITCFGVCGLRVLWLVAAVPYRPTVAMVAWSYPVTWTLATVCFGVYYLRGNWLKRCIARQQRRQRFAQ